MAAVLRAVFTRPLRVLREASQRVASVDSGKTDHKEDEAADDVSGSVSAAGGSTGDKAVGHTDEIRTTHDVEAGGVFKEVDHLVDHGRQHHGDALGRMM